VITKEVCKLCFYCWLLETLSSLNSASAGLKIYSIKLLLGVITVVSVSVSVSKPTSVFCDELLWQLVREETK
jgi:hypothetical protein